MNNIAITVNEISNSKTNFPDLDDINSSSDKLITTLQIKKMKRVENQLKYLKQNQDEMQYKLDKILSQTNKFKTYSKDIVHLSKKLKLILTLPNSIKMPRQLIIDMFANFVKKNIYIDNHGVIDNDTLKEHLEFPLNKTLNSNNLFNQLDNNLYKEAPFDTYPSQNSILISRELCNFLSLPFGVYLSHQDIYTNIIEYLNSRDLLRENGYFFVDAKLGVLFKQTGSYHSKQGKMLRCKKIIQNLKEHYI